MKEIINDESTDQKQQNGLRKSLTNLVVWLYTLLFTLCLPLIFLRLGYRSLKNPAYRQRWLERLGIFPIPSLAQRNGLWVHAVSVGESIAAAPLIRAFQNKFPKVPITVTTTTPTGSAQVKKMFGDSVFHVYFPYDLPWTFNRFLKQLSPKLCVIMETELWVNALRAMKQHHLPCIIVNARLSEKSLLGYKRILFVVRDMLSNITKVAAQSEQDGKRFVALGLDPKRLSIVGNVKFDCNMPENLEENANILRKQWGSHRRVLVAASTHQGEETDILWVFSELKKEFKDLILIIVPRHPERFNNVAEEIQKLNFIFARRSHNNPMNVDTDVFLADTMGELPLFYKAADVVFVGGSLVPIGGHNTLEPAALGKPVVVGPYNHHFSEITKLLQAQGALEQVSNKQDVFTTLQHWLRYPNIAAEAGLRGKKVVAENRGAVDKILKLIQPYF